MGRVFFRPLFSSTGRNVLQADRHSHYFYLAREPNEFEVHNSGHNIVATCEPFLLNWQYYPPEPGLKCKNVAVLSINLILINLFFVSDAIIGSECT